MDRYRARWPWVFVDEYQDVDADQYELLRLLRPPEGNLCAIGDPDQAIYSFRGADVRYFLRFAEDFTDARMVRLTRNYRSAPPIIAAALQAIAPTGWSGTGGWTRPGSSRRRRCSGGTRLPPPRTKPSSSPVPWTSWSAGCPTVAGHRAGGRTAASASVSFSDIAVLYRTDAQAGPIWKR